MDLKYKASFKEGDLKDSISESLMNRHPSLSSVELSELVGSSIKSIKNQGNLALYDGLVKLGIDYAERILKAKPSYYGDSKNDK